MIMVIPDQHVNGLVEQILEAAKNDKISRLIPDLNRYLFELYCKKDYLNECEPEYCSYRILNTCDYINSIQEMSTVHGINIITGKVYEQE